MCSRVKWTGYITAGATGNEFSSVAVSDASGADDTSFTNDDVGGQTEALSSSLNFLLFLMIMLSLSLLLLLLMLWLL